MGPRLTAQQGIELIKIHQLRRENAAIHQQLQILRDVVSDVKDEHETFRERTQESNVEIKTIKTSLSEKQKLYKKVAADVEILLQSKDEMRGCLEESSKETKKYQKVIDERLEELNKTVGDVQVEMKAFEDGYQGVNTELNTAISKIQGELAHKVEATDLDILRNDLADIKTRLVNDLGRQIEIETVLVQRSAEEETIQLETIRPQSASDFTQHAHRVLRASSPDSLFGDPDKITETASCDQSEAAIEPLPEMVATTFSVSEIDLDQNIESARHTSPNDSLVMIPDNQHTKQPDHINKPLEPKKIAVEDLLTYTPWSKQKINPSTVATEEFEGQQLVDGTVDTNLRVTLIRWLQTNNWNWDSLRRSVGDFNSTSFRQNSTPDCQQTPSEHISFHSKVENSPAGDSVTFTPRTPHKNTSCRQDVCDQKTSSASPLIGRILHQRKRYISQDEHPFLDASPIHNSANDNLEVQMPSIDYTPLRPSPYNPRPRLVSKRRLARSGMRPADIGAQSIEIGKAQRASYRSVAEVVSPRILTINEAKVEKSRKRKKKRNIPPAPAIPILSTSSEANKERFNTWYSP